MKESVTHPRARVECAKKQKARAIGVGPWEIRPGLRAGHARSGLRAGRASFSGDRTPSRPSPVQAVHHGDFRHDLRVRRTCTFQGRRAAPCADVWAKYRRGD
jgi:hypothetical protein